MTGQSGQRPRRAAAVIASAEAVEIDAAYGAYDESPLDTPDEWGDLASFRAAAGES